MHALTAVHHVLQVVGLKGGWHTGVVMSGMTRWHAVRLAQVPELSLTLRALAGAPQLLSRLHSGLT